MISAHDMEERAQEFSNVEGKMGKGSHDLKLWKTLRSRGLCCRLMVREDIVHVNAFPTSATPWRDCFCFPSTCITCLASDGAQNDSPSIKTPQSVTKTAVIVIEASGRSVEGPFVHSPRFHMPSPNGVSEGFSAICWVQISSSCPPTFFLS